MGRIRSHFLAFDNVRSGTYGSRPLSPAGAIRVVRQHAVVRCANHAKKSSCSGVGVLAARGTGIWAGTEDAGKTHEEYVLLNVRGLRPGKQSVFNEGGHNYDVLEVTDPKTNQTVKLYFNVDIPFKHYLE